ncbi:polycystin-1-like protein 2 [Ylistrum balloti]|uniref:polycystin-1-like protein 2 n=1 Tax=Ylistrum balloti TaxID=509963 RepID=UPI0029058400|nr:polycystin-1-like protein 2 [Ylistrum balloti]
MDQIYGICGTVAGTGEEDLACKGTSNVTVAYACEGSALHLSCEQGELIQVFQANYGRFNLTVCNHQGRTSGWNLQCASETSQGIVSGRYKFNRLLSRDYVIPGLGAVSVKTYVHIIAMDLYATIQLEIAYIIVGGVTKAAVCSAGTWGDNCGESCEPGCSGGNCNHITGICSSGCVLGYNGKFCDKKNEIVLRVASLDVTVERELPLIVMVQNFDPVHSKVYIHFIDGEPCNLTSGWHEIPEESPEIQVYHGITLNVTGFSHKHEIRHMFSLQTTEVNLTLDNLGVISYYNLTFNPQQHQLILDCFQNASIENTTTDILTPFQAERSFMTQYYINWNLDDDCLGTYGTVTELGYIEITKNRLIASMGPVFNSNQRYNQPLVLDASFSSDPEGTLTVANFQFVWTCVMDDVLPCSIVGINIASDNITMPHTSAVVTLNSQSLQINSSYMFEVTVSTPERLSGKARRQVVIKNDMHPQLEMMCLSNCWNKKVPGVNWELSLYQSQNPKYFHPWSTMDIAWTVYRGSDLIHQVLNTTNYLLVEGNLIHFDTTYSIHVDFKVKVTDDFDLLGSSQLLNVNANDLPVMGSCDCNPARGFSDISTFTISCTGFYDSDTLLTYTLVTNGTVMEKGSSGSFFDVNLPGGISTTDYYPDIAVEVMDVLNGSVTYNVTVQVYPSLAEYTENINQSPVSSSGCVVSPESGYALVTNFSVICGDFSDLDPPLMYYLYYKGQTELLLYKGNSTATTFFYLSEGQGENNTASLVFKANDMYKAATEINLSVQVLPFDTLGTDVLNFVQDNFLSGETDHRHPRLLTVNFVNQGEPAELTLQTIGSLGNVINEDITSANYTNETQAAERLNLRAQMRESLTESLLIADIEPNFDEVNQVSQVLDSLISVKEEVTEKQEELTVIVFGNLTEKLDDVGKTDALETRSTSKNLLASMGSFLTIIKDRGTSIKKINTTASGQITDSSKKEKLEKVKENTLQMLSSVEKVVDILTDTIQVANEPVIVQTPAMAIRVQEITADNKSSEANLTRAVLADNSSIGFLLPPTHILRQSVPGGDNSSVFTQIVVTKDNMYNWDESADRITSSVVDIVVKDKNLQTLTLKNMSNPVTLQFETDGHNLTSHVLKFTYDTSRNQVISSSILKVSMTDLDPVMFIMVYIQITELELTLVVYNSTEDDKISAGTVQQNGTHIAVSQSEDDVTSLMFEVSKELYLSIAVKEGQSITVNQTDGPYVATNVSIRIGTTKTMCGFYNNVTDQWSDDGCWMSPLKELATVTCSCDHLTAFAAGFIIVPNLVDPIGDAALFLTFFDNPVVVITVLVVWSLYLIMMVWARRTDRVESMKGGVSVLEDNCAEDKHVYVVGLVTGWWRHAGTTANVYMYICGDQGYSSKHLLSDGIAQHFQTGAEDWFVLTTPRSLGELRRIVVWHDNSGESPPWFLKQIVIRDVQSEKIWHFLYNNWLAVDRGLGQIKAQIHSLTQDDLVKNSLYQFGLQSSKDLQNNHLWISIISCPAYSPFTRVQRLSCALSLLLTTMLASLMFHGIPTDDPADQYSTSGITLSLSDIVIGIESGLIMFPVNFIIMQLFTKLDHRPSKLSRRKYYQVKNPVGEDELIELGANRSEAELNKSRQPQKRPFRFPWWMIYIAWTLVLSTAVISSYFVMLYGLMYGYQKSIEWLVSFFTGFFQSAFVTEPLKVFVIAVLLAFIFKKPVEFEILNQRDIMKLEEGEDYCQTELLKKQGITLSSIAPVKQAVHPAMPKQMLKALRERLHLEERITIILREMIMYFTFVAVVLFMVHGHQDVATNYSATKNTEDMLVNGKYTPVRLDEVKKVEDMWEYLRGTALPMLYSDTGRMANDVSYLAGTARLRQKRIEKDISCYRVNTEVFASLFPKLDCEVPFSAGDEEWGSFNESWSQPLPEGYQLPESNPWKYRSSWELKTIPFVGTFASYSGGGYVKELPSDHYAANVTLNNLISQEWVDKHTRAIFFEFTSYNPNVDLFTVVVIIFEQSNIGNMLTYYQFFSSKLNHYDSDLGKFVAACESLFLLYLVGFTYFEIKKFTKLQKAEYFSDTWSYFEIMIISLGYCTIGLFFQRLVMVNSVLSEYRENGPDRFTSFYTAVFWDFVLTYVMAALVMLVILKVFKLFRYNTKTTILVQTLARARGNLFNFAIMFFICFMAFTLFANLVFGYWLLDYKDVGSSIITLSHFLLGVSDYGNLEQAHSVLGPAFFFMFAFIIQYILLSVFVAIIIEAQHLTRKIGENELALTKFVYERVLLMIGAIKRSDYI